jgi:hypothetical protein
MCGWGLVGDNLCLFWRVKATFSLNVVSVKGFGGLLI